MKIRILLLDEAASAARGIVDAAIRNDWDLFAPTTTLELAKINIDRIPVTLLVDDSAVIERLWFGEITPATAREIEELIRKGAHGTGAEEPG